MGQKNNNNNIDHAESSTTFVFNVEMHCHGCASKIIRCVRSFQGVETVQADSDAGKLTIVGRLDPSKLRDKLAEKTKKKIDLISPQPKKENKDSKVDKKNLDDKKFKEVNLWSPPSYLH